MASQPAPPIARGYPYDIVLTVDPVISGSPPAFPAGCGLMADIADYPGGPALGTLTTANGSIERLADNQIAVHIPASVTQAITNTNAVFDLVRTDVSPDVWLGVRVQLAVEPPVTAFRPGS